MLRNKYFSSSDTESKSLSSKYSISASNSYFSFISIFLSSTFECSYSFCPLPSQPITFISHILKLSQFSYVSRLLFVPIFFLNLLCVLFLQEDYAVQRLLEILLSFIFHLFPADCGHPLPCRYFCFWYHYH